MNEKNIMEKKQLGAFAPSKELEQIGSIGMCSLDEHEESFADIDTDTGKMRVYTDRMEFYTGTAKQGYAKVKTEFFVLELKKEIWEIANNNGGSVYGLVCWKFKIATANRLIAKAENNYWYPTEKAKYTPAEQQEEDRRILNDWNNQPRATKVFKRNGETVYTRDANTKKLVPITYTTDKTNLSDIPTFEQVYKTFEQSREKLQKWRDSIKSFKYDRTTKTVNVFFKDGKTKQYSKYLLRHLLPQKEHPEPNGHGKYETHEQKDAYGKPVSSKVWQPHPAETVSNGSNAIYYCNVCDRGYKKSEITVKTVKTVKNGEVIRTGCERLCPKLHSTQKYNRDEIYLNQFGEPEYDRRKANYSIDENGECTEINTADEEPIN